MISPDNSWKHCPIELRLSRSLPATAEVELLRQGNYPTDLSYWYVLRAGWSQASLELGLAEGPAIEVRIRLQQKATSQVLGKLGSTCRQVGPLCVFDKPGGLSV